MFLKVCDGVGACCREKAVRLLIGINAGMVRIVGRKEDGSWKGAGRETGIEVKDLRRKLLASDLQGYHPKQGTCRVKHKEMETSCCQMLQLVLLAAGISAQLVGSSSFAWPLLALNFHDGPWMTSCCTKCFPL